MNLIDTIPRIEAWNALRYEREYNADLSFKLLDEEIEELYTALVMPIPTYEDALNRYVEIADALGDIFYVAVGVLWKLNKPWAFYDVMYLRNDLKTGVPIYLFQDWQPLMATDPVAGAKSILAKTLRCAEAFMSSEDFSFVVHAICDSNDSKAVKKTASDVKANISKGANYFSPTEALMEIAAKYVPVENFEC